MANIKDEYLAFYENVQINLKNVSKVKNYRKMCELLNETVKTNSKSKASQLEFWSKFFYFKKYGNEFRDIYIYPQDVIYQNIQDRMMDDILLYIFYNIMEEYYQKYSGSLAVTISELGCLLGFVQENFLNYYPRKLSLAYNLDNALLSDNTDEKFIKNKQLEIKKFRLDNNFDERNISSELIDIEEKQKYSHGDFKKVNLISTYQTSVNVDDFFSHVYPSYYKRIKNLINRIIDIDEKTVDKTLFGVFKINKNEVQDINLSYRGTRELTGEEKQHLFSIQTEVFKSFGISNLNDAYKKNIQNDVSEEISKRTVNEMSMYSSFSVLLFTSSPNTIEFNKENFKKQLLNNNSTFIIDINEAKNKRMLQYKRGKSSPYIYKSFDRLSDTNKEQYLLNQYMYSVLSDKLIKLDNDSINDTFTNIFQKSINRYNIHNNLINKNKFIVSVEDNPLSIQNNSTSIENIINTSNITNNDAIVDFDDDNSFIF